MWNPFRKRRQRLEDGEPYAAFLEKRAQELENLAREVINAHLTPWTAGPRGVYAAPHWPCEGRPAIQPETDPPVCDHGAVLLSTNLDLNDFIVWQDPTWAIGQANVIRKFVTAWRSDYARRRPSADVRFYALTAMSELWRAHPDHPEYLEA